MIMSRNGWCGSNDVHETVCIGLRDIVKANGDMLVEIKAVKEMCCDQGRVFIEEGLDSWHELSGVVVMDDLLHEVLAVPPLFLQESSHSGGIPVDSGGIPVDSGGIPVDSGGMKFSRRPC